MYMDLWSKEFEDTRDVAYGIGAINLKRNVKNWCFAWV